MAERVFNSQEVTEMLELIYMIEGLYQIDFLDVDERFEATVKMYDKFEKLYEEDSLSSNPEFGYMTEMYQSKFTDEIVTSVLNELKIDYMKF